MVQFMLAEQRISKIPFKHRPLGRFLVATAKIVVAVGLVSLLSWQVWSVAQDQLAHRWCQAFSFSTGSIVDGEMVCAGHVVFPMIPGERLPQKAEPKERT